MAVTEPTPVPRKHATRIVRNWASDSRHWERYRPRPGDVIIGTAPKVGTTWMQQIVRLLIFQDPAPQPIGRLSPWLDSRFHLPLDVVIPMIEAQTHRRFLKTHLPLDALPFYEEVRYIHVGRDPRDAAMSFFNHYMSFTPEAIAAFDGIGLADETIGRPYPRAPEEPRAFFLQWLTGSADDVLNSAERFFDIERSYWSERGRQNLLLAHYNDLKADLDGEMRRIAAFLEVDVPEDKWPSLVQAATFDQMKVDGGQLMAGAERIFKGGHRSFLHKGSNGRWRDVLTEEDQKLYARFAETASTQGLRVWLEQGRLGSGDSSLVLQ